MAGASVLIPTIGRPTLGRAVLSAARETCVNIIQVVRDDPPHGDWGHSIRHRYAAHLPGPWVVFLDDDMELYPTQLTSGLAEAPREAVALLFNVKVKDGRIVPGDGRVELGNMDGLGLVVKTKVLQRIPWPATKEYAGDWMFYSSLVEQGIPILRVPRLIGGHIQD